MYQACMCTLVRRLKNNCLYIRRLSRFPSESRYFSSTGHIVDPLHLCAILFFVPLCRGIVLHPIRESCFNIPVNMPVPPNPVIGHASVSWTGREKMREVIYLIYLPYLRILFHCSTTGCEGSFVIEYINKIESNIISSLRL